MTENCCSKFKKRNIFIFFLELMVKSCGRIPSCFACRHARKGLVPSCSVPRFITKNRFISATVFFFFY